MGKSEKKAAALVDVEYLETLADIQLVGAGEVEQAEEVEGVEHVGHVFVRTALFARVLERLVQYTGRFQEEGEDDGLECENAEQTVDAIREGGHRHVRQDAGGDDADFRDEHQRVEQPALEAVRDLTRVVLAEMPIHLRRTRTEWRFGQMENVLVLEGDEQDEEKEDEADEVEREESSRFQSSCISFSEFAPRKQTHLS